MTVMKEVLALLSEGRDLEAGEMESAVGVIMDGQASAVEMAAFLAALRVKGETVTELVAAVKAMRARAVKVDVEGSLLDTCGTGGDGLGTFNISTATAFVAAAAGARVAKHGNRAASGKVGAADVLEALGARIDLGPDQAARCLQETGIAFLFAPIYHPAVKHVAPVRRELGFRTLFNLIGPLSNPAGADCQLLGLFSADWLEPVAEALQSLGTRRALVVHGADGSDEISAVGPTLVVEVADGRRRSYSLDPAEVGVETCSMSELLGSDAEGNAALIREILAGKESAPARAVQLNAAAAIWISGCCGSFEDGVAKAASVLAEGLALEVLDSFVGLSQELGG